VVTAPDVAALLGGLRYLVDQRSPKMETVVILSCSWCKFDLYRTEAWPPIPGSVVDSALFKPVGDLPAPRPGQSMACPICGEPLAVGSPMFGVDPRFFLARQETA